MTRLEEEKQKEFEYRAKLEKKMIDTDAGFMKQVVSSPEMSMFSQKDALLMGIEKIEKSIKRARKITHQLLGHVKKPESKFSEVNLKALLYETFGLLKREIKNKQININWEIDKKKNIVWSDPYQIQQVLMNLLSNAVHALSENGSITLSTREIYEDIILEIKDTGIGIPKENLGKIFDPFFTTKSFDEGTGLGLFVVHKIISNLNGKIDVSSTVGECTCFQLSLPKYTNQTDNDTPR